MSQSNSVDKYLEEMKKAHPERIVDGKYYEDDEEFAKAKKEYDEMIAKEQEKINQKVQEDTEKTKATDASINNALYGDSVEFSSENLKFAVGGLEMDAIVGNTERVKARQHLLDPEKFEKEFKDPNPGKMPHNKDPFPVDLKIEELEVHKPDVKIHEITTHVHGEPAAKAALYIGDMAEKRLIHLENNMATIMRYLFRLGSRVQINCQYYGGQSPFQKYKCIRCLHDDRINDGQLVQIDQCLCCTRYEPILGQCYEIMNDLGASVAQILDDNQMAYTNMEDYVNKSKVEKYVQELPKGKFDLSKVLVQGEDATNFDEVWGPGVTMDWTPVPKEDQRCHINWRQSINDDGSGLQRLASFPQNEVDSMGFMDKGNLSGNLIRENYNAMESCGNALLSELISKGRDMRQKCDEAVSEAKSGGLEAARTAINGQKIDTILVLALHTITGKSYKEIVSEYANFQGSFGTSNPAIIVTGMGIGNNLIKVPDLDEKNSKDSKGTSMGTKPKRYNLLKEPNVDTILWVDFISKLGSTPTSSSSDKDGGSSSAAPSVNPVLKMEGAALFPKAVYLYIAMSKFLRQSKYDTDSYSFPFTDEQIAQYGIEITSPYGPRNYNGHSYHYGIDIGAGPVEGVEFHSAADGTVVDVYSWDPGNHSISVQNSDGTWCRYLHGNAMVREGQKVSRGDVLGTIGGWGPNGPHHYDYHLHFEFGRSGNPATLPGTAGLNPAEFLPGIMGKTVL